MTIHAFPPISTPTATRLILGSMPGVASLQAQQYYAHPRNAFWPIMAQLLRFDGALPYASRVAALQTAGIAVWDVLQSCERVGSLDAAIAPASIVANDFAQFFAQHPQITHVFFNGSLAEATFKRTVLPQLNLLPQEQTLQYARLPSSSPAHAALSADAKLAQWRQVITDS
ncbi:DNA-deoxyinosine glycosylase [Parvibium lacunae]|uniref:DNA-deoxyinosine glycosylase n=1 Tax=Parvibium lacunae TaxID=1888893 RepID=A0A368L6E2_9BURK|nr:DNA-deoxyinosine glycosylase [Parvibium lacunae]RCS59258.1 DNA-deoxyinosine glycosylase [Parvibium lacunae]